MRYLFTIYYGIQLANFVFAFTFKIFDKSAALKDSKQRNGESKTIIVFMLNQLTY